MKMGLQTIVTALTLATCALILILPAEPQDASSPESRSAGGCTIVEVGPRVRQVICPRSQDDISAARAEPTVQIVPAREPAQPYPAVREPIDPDTPTLRVIRGGVQTDLPLVRREGEVLLVRGGRSRLVSVR